MLHLLKKIFLFLLYGVTAYLGILIFSGEFMPAIFKPNLNYSLGSYGHMYTRIREVEKHRNIDILFVGSSHTYRGFDTRIAKTYGYESFNLGSSAQTPVQTKLLLEEYIDVLNPKILIYDVSPYIFSNDGIESSLDIIANGKIDGKVLKMAFELNNIRTYNSLIYGYYRQLFNRNNNFSETAVIKEDTYIPGGFVERKLAYNNQDINAEKEMTHWVPLQYQLEAFEKIIELAKKKGIKLILVQTPVTRGELNKYTDSNKTDSFFSGKATYYNFNKLLHLSDTVNFYNADHLNQTGVKIFNDSLFIKILKK